MGYLTGLYIELINLLDESITDSKKYVFYQNELKIIRKKMFDKLDDSFS